jgi:predicted dehydrogenase
LQIGLDRRRCSIKIAIAGIGNVARNNYLPFLHKQKDVELGCWNRTAAAATEAAQRFGGIAFANLEELAAWGSDAVLVLTRETGRHDVSAQLLAQARIKRLFFEKPLVAARGQAHVSEEDFENGKSLLALARGKKCETAMVFNYRFFEQTMAARAIANDRNFGAAMHVAAQVHYACWSHCIDLVHYFAGEIEEIAATSGSVVRTSAGFEAADIAASFRLASGGVGSLIGTAALAWQYPLYEMTLAFERGRITMRDLDGTLEILDSKNNYHEVRSLVRDRSRWDAYNASFERSLGAYLDSIRNGQKPPIAGADGLRELQTEAAIKRSIRERRPVRVAEEFPLL